MVPVLLSVLIAYGVNGCLTVSIYDVMLLIKELPYVPQLKPLHAYKLQAKHIVAAPSGLSTTGEREDESLKRRKTSRRRRREMKKGSPSSISTLSSLSSSSSSPREQCTPQRGAERREERRREGGDRGKEEAEVFTTFLCGKRSAEREEEKEREDRIQRRGTFVLSLYEQEEEDESSPTLYRKEFLHRTSLSLCTMHAPTDVGVMRDRTKERKKFSPPWECTPSSSSVLGDTQEEVHERKMLERELRDSFNLSSLHDDLAGRMKDKRPLAFLSSSSSEKDMKEVSSIEKRFGENSHEENNSEKGDRIRVRREKQKESFEKTRVCEEREEERDGWVRDEEALERERRREEDREEREKGKEAKEEEEGERKMRKKKKKKKTRKEGDGEDAKMKNEEENDLENEEREQEEEEEEEATDDMEVSYPLEFTIVLDKDQGTL
ncbi:hypothetical protein CSUI_007492, partial [Cystoisospora suis]